MDVEVAVKPWPAAPTIGSIAERCGVGVHQVRYVIDSRGIRPSAKAGNARVFSEQDVERIREELQRIARAKEQNRGGNP